MTGPVTKGRIAIAAKTLANADVAAVACRKAGLSYFAACTLLEKESGGKNCYGSDEGGVLRGFPAGVAQGNFEAFEWEVVTLGRTSNGVGPCQITYRPYFGQMREQGLKPWLPAHSMLFGFRLLAGNYANTGNWAAAFARYNGGPKPNADAIKYGKDGATKVAEWKQRLGIR